MLRFAVVGGRHGSTNEVTKETKDATTSGVRESGEAIEARHRALYHDGVSLMRAGHDMKARDVLQTTLNHTSFHHDPPVLSRPLAHLKFLLLKNLATCEEKLGNIAGALTNLLSAALLDARPYTPDVTHWRRIANHAITTNQLPLSRMALERALILEPDDWRTIDDLVTVLVTSADIVAMRPILEHALYLDAHYAKGRLLWNTFFASSSLPSSSSSGIITGVIDHTHIVACVTKYDNDHHNSGDDHDDDINNDDDNRMHHDVTSLVSSWQHIHTSNKRYHDHITASMIHDRTTWSDHGTRHIICDHASWMSMANAIIDAYYTCINIKCKDGVIIEEESSDDESSNDSSSSGDTSSDSNGDDSDDNSDGSDAITSSGDDDDNEDDDDGDDDDQDDDDDDAKKRRRRNGSDDDITTTLNGHTAVASVKQRDRCSDMRLTARVVIEIKPPAAPVPSPPPAVVTAEMAPISPSNDSVVSHDATTATLADTSSIAPLHHNNTTIVPPAVEQVSVSALSSTRSSSGASHQSSSHHDDVLPFTQPPEPFSSLPSTQASYIPLDDDTTSGAASTPAVPAPDDTTASSATSSSLVHTVASESPVIAAAHSSLATPCAVNDVPPVISVASSSSPSLVPSKETSDVLAFVSMYASHDSISCNSGICDVSARLLDYVHHLKLPGTMMPSDIALKLVAIAAAGHYDIDNLFACTLAIDTAQHLYKPRATAITRAATLAPYLQLFDHHWRAYHTIHPNHHDDSSNSSSEHNNLTLLLSWLRGHRCMLGDDNTTALHHFNQCDIIIHARHHHAPLAIINDSTTSATIAMDERHDNELEHAPVTVASSSSDIVTTDTTTTTTMVAAATAPPVVETKDVVISDHDNGMIATTSADDAYDSNALHLSCSRHDNNGHITAVTISHIIARLQSTSTASSSSSSVRPRRRRRTRLGR